MSLQNMIEDGKTRDIIPIFSGHEICKKNHKFGPYVRSYYLIHFCLEGEGVLFDKYGKHEIKKGELFIIRPGEITTYAADGEKPWEYSWIAFGGDAARIFDTGASVYAFPAQIGLTLKELTLDGVSSPAVFISLIFRLIYELFSEAKESGNIVEKMKRYIKFNYMNEITVQKISDYFGFERSYLYRVFKKTTGIGIKDYITKTRMNEAKALLLKGVSVGSAARAVGYRDQFNFSKAYKAYFGTPPKKA